LFIHLRADLDESAEHAETTVTRNEETVVKAGREFSVAYSEDLITALRELHAVTDIWFN
jgi:hypothetical protein